MGMTQKHAYCTLLRLHILAFKLARADLAAAATGRPLPRDFAPLLAETRAITGAFGVEVQAATARRRFIARTSR
jgi:hypothetical protein